MINPATVYAAYYALNHIPEIVGVFRAATEVSVSNRLGEQAEALYWQEKRDLSILGKEFLDVHGDRSKMKLLLEEVEYNQVWYSNSDKDIQKDYARTLQYMRSELEAITTTN